MRVEAEARGRGGGADIVSLVAVVLGRVVGIEGRGRSSSIISRSRLWAVVGACGKECDGPAGYLCWWC